MFVDELKIYAKAGDGGDGVVRWLHLKFKPMAGPAGGNGGRGGDVYLRGVRDLNILSKYTGDKKFIADNGQAGMSDSQYGKNGEDLFIDLPVGARVTDLQSNRVYEVIEVGETIKILKGGNGGIGNEHFKTSVNRSPEVHTLGRKGEGTELFIELSLIADVGLVGLPNAGKSTLLNLLTNARSQVGAYAFTTLEPHLGSFYGYTIADIPGLIEGAHKGKGLGDKFLRHVSRTKMILHLVSLDSDDPKSDFLTVKNELTNFSSELSLKDTWIILTKKDLVDQAKIDTVTTEFDKISNHVIVIAENDAETIKNLSDKLTAFLKSK